jgi:hypothetical protein
MNEDLLFKLLNTAIKCGFCSILVFLVLKYAVKPWIDFYMGKKRENAQFQFQKDLKEMSIKMERDQKEMSIKTEREKITNEWIKKIFDKSFEDHAKKMNES